LAASSFLFFLIFSMASFADRLRFFVFSSSSSVSKAAGDSAADVVVVVGVSFDGPAAGVAC
jgi:hypothetical protein